MSLYCDGSSSWCSAAPTVRMSANTSKPSKVQPRLEATSAFHCVRSSDRYQGDGAMVTDSVIISSLMALAAARDEKFTLLSGALGRVRRGHCPADQSLGGAGEQRRRSA